MPNDLPLQVSNARKALMLIDQGKYTRVAQFVQMAVFCYTCGAWALWTALQLVLASKSVASCQLQSIFAANSSTANQLHQMNQMYCTVAGADWSTLNPSSAWSRWEMGCLYKNEVTSGRPSYLAMSFTLLVHPFHLVQVRSMQGVLKHFAALQYFPARRCCLHPYIMLCTSCCCSTNMYVLHAVCRTGISSM